MSEYKQFWILDWGSSHTVETKPHDEGIRVVEYRAFEETVDKYSELTSKHMKLADMYCIAHDALGEIAYLEIDKMSKEQWCLWRKIAKDALRKLKKEIR